MSAAQTSVATVAVVGVKAGPMQRFESFLRVAGHLVGVALADIVKFALPITAIVQASSPEASPAEAAFLSVVQLISGTVITIEQKWAAMGQAADAQKLADVLLIVEQPVMALFRAAGVAVDAAYVLNLVNGVVALLRAQPGDVLVPMLKQV